MEIGFFSSLITDQIIMKRNVRVTIWNVTMEFDQIYHVLLQRE